MVPPLFRRRSSVHGAAEELIVVERVIKLELKICVVICLFDLEL